jgi:hypothetical protein
MPGRLQVVRQKYGMEAGPPGNARVELGQAAFSIRVARLHGGVGSGHGKRRRPTVFRKRTSLEPSWNVRFVPNSEILGLQPLSGTAG